MSYPLIEKSICINTSLQKLWNYLTVPELMLKWTTEPELKIEILTNWKVGTAFIIKGFHYAEFENRGEVMQFTPHSLIQYFS